MEIPARGITLAQLARLGDAHARLLSCPAAELPQALVESVVDVVDGLGAAVLQVSGDDVPQPLASTRNYVLTDHETGLLREVAADGDARLLADVWLSTSERHQRGSQRRSLVLAPVQARAGMWVVLVWHDLPNHLGELALELTTQLCADVTHRAARQTRGGAEGQLLTALAESSDDAVLVTSGEGLRIAYANRAAETLLNERAVTLIGQRAVPSRWTWRTPEGEPLRELPAAEVLRTGRAVRHRVAHILPVGVDPDTPEGKAAERVLQIDAVPAGADPETGEPLLVTRLRDITVAAPTAGLSADDEQRLATMELVVGLAWWAYEPSRATIVWSRRMYEIAGLDPNGPRISREAYLELVHPEDRWMFADAGAAEAPEVGTTTYRLQHSDGGYRQLTNWYRRFTSASGQTRLVGLTMDDTVRDRALRSMAERRYQFERAFDGSPLGTLLVSLAPANRGQVLRVNRCLTDLLALHQLVHGSDLSEVLRVRTPEGPRPMTLAEVLELARNGERSVYQLLRSDDTFAWTWVTAIAVEDVEADDPFLLVNILDITSQQLQQEELELIARTDTLTGLPNRSVVTATLDRLCEGVTPVTVLMLDLDRFKAINDGYGHHVGDELLVSVGARLAALVPEHALVGRLGGDEFTVVLSGYSAGDTDLLARRIVREVARPHDLPSGRRVVTGVSLGVAECRRPHERDCRAALLRDADLAMYRAKDNGGSQVVWCDHQLRETSARRHDVESRLRAGIEAGNLVVYRQPVVRLDTFGLAGHEALVRLVDPEIGLMEPASFIPLAEQTGLIADIDHWVLNQVLRLIKHDRRYGADSNLHVAVNFSAQTLQREDVVPRMQRALERHGVAAERVVLEITESRLLIDDGPWMASLAQLRADRVRLAVDDFGTGYSGFSYLHQVRPDLLKIDRSFVAALDPLDYKPVSTIAAIVQMAHAHDIAVIAEGVETHRQAMLLRNIGCDFAQGWLYGRPQPWKLAHGHNQ